MELLLLRRISMLGFYPLLFVSSLGPRGIFHGACGPAITPDQHDAGSQIQAGEPRPQAAAHQARNARLGWQARTAQRRVARTGLALRAVHGRRAIRIRDFLSLSQ